MTILGDKLMRATELARLLTLEKSVKGAIKLATVLKLPILAERFNLILEVIDRHYFMCLFVKVLVFKIWVFDPPY